MSGALREELLSVVAAIKPGISAQALLREDLLQCPPQGVGRLRVLAIGKAAPSMAEAALEVLGTRIDDVLCIGSESVDWEEESRVTMLSGEHPVPGIGSFKAGAALLKWARDACSAGKDVMVLLSGGASALCEWPKAGISQDALALKHREWVSSGQSIEDINQQRGVYSALKAGGLADILGTSLIDVRVLVDVPSGDPYVVGSGPCTSPRYVGPVRSIGEPQTLVARVKAAFDALGRTSTICAEPRAWSFEELSDQMVHHGKMGDGAWVTAGEVRVSLPSDLLDVNEGGRAQHLALHVASRLLGHESWAILAWASDGCDGRGGAGALISSDDAKGIHRDSVEQALVSWQSGSYLASIGCRLNSFASETNLTDLYIVLRP